MSQDEYKIEYLIEAFGKHHEDYLKDIKILEDKIASGEVQLQEWMKESFSISLALQTICKEIKALKEYR